MQTASLKTELTPSNTNNLNTVDFSFTPEPVFKILDRAATKFANNPAVDFEGLRYTYSEFAALVDKVAAGLQEMGVSKGH